MTENGWKKKKAKKRLVDFQKAKRNIGQDHFERLQENLTIKKI